MKRITTILVAAVVSILLLQCKKETKDMNVYRPATQSITFSEVTDFIIDSTGKTVSLKTKIASKAGLQKVEILYQ
ncbi:MAG: hypothetical protein H7296_09320, partial [Bacteroidia bacterium]|nr:hypothetical protein [Bacteroidia bacterium]